MISLAYFRLRLVDPVHNRDRDYELQIDSDLFGDVIVCVRFGRYGCTLREITYLTDSRSTAEELAEHILRRRLSARQRLGSAYVVVEASGEYQNLLRYWHERGGADARSVVKIASMRPRQRNHSSPRELPLFAA